MKYHYTAQYFNEPRHPISVYLIGCGGTGSQVLSGLGRINHALQALNHPGLFVYTFDGDTVSETNIGRQLFSPVDIGLNKATVLTTRINRFFGTGWQSIPEHFSFGVLDRLNPANIYITCVDSAIARVTVSEIVKSAKNGYDQSRPYYWLDFGNSHKIGQIVLGTIRPISQPQSQFETVERLPTVVEEFPEIFMITDDDPGPSCSIAQALGRQDLFINSTLSQLGCALLWKLLAESRITNRGAYLNLDTMSVNPIKL